MYVPVCGGLLEGDRAVVEDGRGGRGLAGDPERRVVALAVGVVPGAAFFELHALARELVALVARAEVGLEELDLEDAAAARGTADHVHAPRGAARLDLHRLDAVVALARGGAERESLRFVAGHLPLRGRGTC